VLCCLLSYLPQSFCFFNARCHTRAVSSSTRTFLYWIYREAGSVYVWTAVRFLSSLLSSVTVVEVSPTACRHLHTHARKSGATKFECTSRPRICLMRRMCRTKQKKEGSAASWRGTPRPSPQKHYCTWYCIITYPPSSTYARHRHRRQPDDDVTHAVRTTSGRAAPPLSSPPLAAVVE
jgi:3',5'-cyclic AMP phosphodiesterase CpdA